MQEQELLLAPVQVMWCHQQCLLLPANLNLDLSGMLRCWDRGGGLCAREDQSPPRRTHCQLFPWDHETGQPGAESGNAGPCK